MLRNKTLKSTLIFTLLISLIVGCAPSKAPDDQTQKQDKPKVSILIPGNHNDNGFMEAGYRGYTKIKDALPVDVSYVSDVSATSDQAVLTEAMRELAKKGANMIIGHGGQCNEPAKTVSKEFPNIKFVVIQGNVKGDNLSSYVVKQEQSAWLAGALAGLTTKTNIVGHISGAWPNPGLLGRAAFYDGLKYVNPNAKFLTWFTGNLDDLEINRKAAEAEIKNNADVIYTMLNAGRPGVINEIKKSEGKVRHIGNVSDWTQVDKQFIGSAVADSSVAIFNSVNDFINGKWQANQVTEIGLKESDIVNITMAGDVPNEVKAKIDEFKGKLISGEIKIKTTYEGKEFYPATGEFVDQSFKTTLGK